jgi:hypothetical protein
MTRMNIVTTSMIGFLAHFHSRTRLRGESKMKTPLHCLLILVGVAGAACAGHAPEGIYYTSGKGWSTIFRLYGPLEPWFKKTWRPSEIELVK